MSADSRKVWRRILRDFGPAGVLTAADADVLRVFCDVVVRYEKAARMLDESSPLLSRRNATELVKNPLVQVVRDNANLLRTLARELGLTPSSRSGVSGTPTSGDDPLEHFLR